jgi:uncharacterized phage protein gp47/JayE
VNDLLDFVPLFPLDTEETILARMADWANEGLAPDDDRWVDTREGGHWRTCVTPVAREQARLYDLMGTEVPASAIPFWSWGTYLDDIAETYDEFRLAATRADGVVTFTGPLGTAIPAGTEVGVNPVDEDAPAPTFQTTADVVVDADLSVDAPVIAVEVGSASNVGVGAVAALSTPIAGVTVTNAAAMVGGTDVETDEALLGRLREVFEEGQASGTKGWYLKVARNFPGVGYAVVLPLWAGPGTVKVVILDADLQPSAGAVVAALQAELDPVGAGAGGEAPVNHVVTVETGVILPIDVAAVIEFEEGYSLDAAPGTTALRSTIEASIARYIRSVKPGSEVVLTQVEGRISSVEGVHDVKNVRLNGGAVNVPTDDDPAQIARLDDTAGLVQGAVP